MGILRIPLIEWATGGRFRTRDPAQTSVRHPERSEGSVHRGARRLSEKDYPTEKTPAGDRFHQRNPITVPVKQDKLYPGREDPSTPALPPLRMTGRRRLAS